MSANVTSSTARAPDTILMAGHVQAAIWRHGFDEREGQDSRERIRIERRYFDEGAKAWRSSPSFFVSDLPDLMALAAQLAAWLRVREVDPRRTGAVGPSPVD